MTIRTGEVKREKTGVPRIRRACIPKVMEILLCLVLLPTMTSVFQSTSNQSMIDRARRHRIGGGFHHGVSPHH